MYTPPYFKISERKEMEEIIDEFGFATLFSIHDGEPCATQLPLLLTSDGSELVGHFAKGNTQWKDLDGQSVLVVFQGPHCYISPSWYESQNNVPTWNYVTVHVKGKVHIMENEDPRLWQSMVHLTEKYEDIASDYSLDEVNEDLLANLSKGVVGFTICIEQMEGKAKLSQNHSKERRERVITALNRTGRPDERAIAKWMDR
jgi:transcriptional regulator